MNALECQVVSLKDTSSTVRKLMGEHEADTFIGSMMTAKGIFVLLFSHRLNRDYSFVVSSQEMSPVLAKVYEALAGKKEDVS